MCVASKRLTVRLAVVCPPHPNLDSAFTTRQQPSRIPGLDMPDSRFGYFLLQTRVARDLATTSAEVSLTVEDLSSGEKRVFASVTDFSRFLSRLVNADSDDRWAPPTDA